MKLTDDYGAKIRLWAADQKVWPAQSIGSLPKFSGQKFRSHEEMNRWKEDYLRRIARDSDRHG
jgi:hypothetical protein